MYKQLKIASIALIFAANIEGFTNTDLEQAIVFSKLNVVKEILNSKKTITAQERTAYLSISKKILKIRHKLLGSPELYKDQISSKISTLLGVMLVSGFIGTAVLFALGGIYPEKTEPFMASSFALSIVSAFLIPFKRNYDNDLCGPLASEYYSAAASIHSLLSKTPTKENQRIISVH